MGYERHVLDVLVLLVLVLTSSIDRESEVGTRVGPSPRLLLDIAADPSWASSRRRRKGRVGSAVLRLGRVGHTYEYYSEGRLLDLYSYLLLVVRTQDPLLVPFAAEHEE